MDRSALIAAMQATAAAPPVAVEVEGWGRVYVRALTVAEMDEASEVESSDKNKVARGACRVICDETGHRLFDPKSDADVELIAKQPWSMLRKVLAASDPVSGKA